MGKAALPCMRGDGPMIESMDVDIIHMILEAHSMVFGPEVKEMGKEDWSPEEELIYLHHLYIKVNLEDSTTVMYIYMKVTG